MIEMLITNNIQDEKATNCWTEEKAQIDTKIKHIFCVKIKHIIFSTLTLNIYTKILSCMSTKDMWTRLEETYETKKALLKNNLAQQECLYTWNLSMF